MEKAMYYESRDLFGQVVKTSDGAKFIILKANKNGFVLVANTELRALIHYSSLELI